MSAIVTKVSNVRHTYLSENSFIIAKMQPRSRWNQALEDLNEENAAQQAAEPPAMVEQTTAVSKQVNRSELARWSPAFFSQGFVFFFFPVPRMLQNFRDIDDIGVVYDYSPSERSDKHC